MKEFVDDTLDELNAALRQHYEVVRGRPEPTTDKGVEYITYAAVLNASTKKPQDCVAKFMDWWLPQIRDEFPNAAELVLRTQPSIKVEYIARDDLCGNITIDTSAPYLRVRIRCAFE